MKLFNVVYLVTLLLVNSLAEPKGLDKTQQLDKSERLKLCFVEGRGSYKKSQFCPLLEAKSNLGCVIGNDRLDCIRRISKGTAHFGVFTAEDLATARWAGSNVLITSELRFQDTFFEYEFVAVVDNEAGINSPQDLRGAKFCHPGVGLTSHWTDVLANYFESTLVARECEDDLSLTESRLKASANFFGPTCKAGPWVPDPVQDALLKKRYPSLCNLCYDKYTCGVGDKHWGRQGPLYCLTSGAGDVAWARLDDVKFHFGFSGIPSDSNPNQYSFLCPDGHLQPLNSPRPCIWTSKPWPAIAAHRSVAERVQNTVAGISHDDLNSWQNALLNLIESYHVNVTTLDMAIPIDTYLDQAVGFQSAYSFPSCNPPRSIVFCTMSIIEHVKCSWLQESATIHGIEPNLQCVRGDSLDHCMKMVQHKAADMVVVDQDNRVKAQKVFNLKPILYEYAEQTEHNYVIYAVVRVDSNIQDIEDLRGKKACFPGYESAAHLSVLQTLKELEIFSNNSCGDDVKHYFSSESCIWSTDRMCDEHYRGDEGALRCLEERGDVAFIGLEMIKKFKDGHLHSPWAYKLNPSKYRTLCPFKEDTPYRRHAAFKDTCYLHWTPKGQVMINREAELMRRNEIYNAIRDMDNLFGPHHKSHSLPYTLYGPFDRRNNVIFNDKTTQLHGIIELNKVRGPRLLEPSFNGYTDLSCEANNARRHSVQYSLVLILPLLGYVIRSIISL